VKITIAGYGSIGRYYEAILGAKHEIACYDPPKGLGREADLRDTDFVFVCVPTPTLAGGVCDTTAVEAVVDASGPREAIVCLSTVSIGTTRRLIGATGKPIVFVPEYAGESPEHPYRDPAGRDFFVFGGNEPAASKVVALFRGVFPAEAEYNVTDPTTAETVKYMENAFLALKVAFCNEIYDLCARTGVDYEAARRLWVQDWRIGESHTQVTAERGYDGKCLPKDVAALCGLARQAGAPLTIMEAVQDSNRRVRQAVGSNVAAITTQPTP
jgi:UDPglucose 6-dehydrogenase